MADIKSRSKGAANTGAEVVTGTFGAIGALAAGPTILGLRSSPNDGTEISVSRREAPLRSMVVRV